MTEMDDAATRSHQSIALIPEELTAYEKLTQRRSCNTPRLLGWEEGKQDRSGLVPGGFVVWLAYEKAPGLRLGNKNGSGSFWALDPAERDQICSVFLKSFEYVCAACIPDLASLLTSTTQGVVKGWALDDPSARS